jgi:membrane-associated phospholipid phosphatase
MTRVLARARSVLPNGPVDLLRQIVLFCGAYWLYRIARGLVDSRAAEAFDNARAVIDVERDLGLFIEPAVHAWASGQALLIDASSWMYLNSHFAVTTVTLAWIYLRRNERFYFVRNMFMVAMGIALVGYVALPTAPPRFMPEWGFEDSVAAFTGVEADSASADLLFNPYAAIPSMHVAFALMLGVSMARIVRRRWARALWLAYAPVVTFVVVATANHWWLDAFLGAAVAVAAAACAQAFFARVRPEVWAWNVPARPHAGTAV